MNSRRARVAAGIATAGLAAGAAVVAFAWRRAGQVALPVRRLELPRWPREFAGLRIAVVADLHAGAPQVDARRLGRLVERVNAARPDLVVLLGDYVDPSVLLGDHVRPRDVAGALSALRPIHAVVAVLGNHDVDYSRMAVRTALEQAGLRTLEDEAVDIALPGGAVALRGLSADASTTRRGGRLRAEPGAAATILLSHSPDAFGRADAGIALTIAGHTHGAQIDIPLLRRLVIPARFAGRLKEGHVVEDDRHLFVTRGVGTSHVPLRLGAPAEIPILELYPVADGSSEASSSDPSA